MPWWCRHSAAPCSDSSFAFLPACINPTWLDNTLQDDAYSSEDETTSTSAAAPEAGAASPIERARAAAAEDPADTDAITAALNDLDAELNSLREAAPAAEARAASLEASAATAKDQLLRLSADFENFRRRTATEKDDITNRVRGDVVGQLLPLVDNFELARTQVRRALRARTALHGGALPCIASISFSPARNPALCNAA